ncbi:hypothetical protein GCM10007354_11210 [Acinetobacter courvalinii]|uniref:Uncharacterized protein n=1 Tax=Acinetobacter courvalinii TaxID=280147 RepID=A0ABD0A5G2_9GAMM|nr:hypothetical protein GCM10007354_11210 [Acinetobacter courvalinii]
MKNEKRGRPLCFIYKHFSENAASNFELKKCFDPLNGIPDQECHLAKKVDLFKTHRLVHRTRVRQPEPPQISLQFQPLTGKD